MAPHLIIAAPSFWASECFKSRKSHVGTSIFFHVVHSFGHPDTNSIPSVDQIMCLQKIYAI